MAPSSQSSEPPQFPGRFNLIKKGKIDASWAGVKLDQSEIVDGKKTKEWKLTFKNPVEKDAAKQTLYMFYSLSGNFLAANFTGK